MTKQNYPLEIETELDNIIEHLLSNAVQTDNELFWPTLAVGMGSVDVGTNETIYKGNCGIMLFFLEAYNNNKRDQRLFNVVKKSCTWIDNYCKANPSDFYALYTGRMSVSYAFMRVYEVTGEVGYLSEAIAIAQKCQVREDNSGAEQIDLINGAAGNLLTLLHLYIHSKDDLVLIKIKQFTMYILDNIEINDKGIYWQRKKSDIRGLCGTSHGASGIGWVLLQVAKLFADKPLADLSLQAIHYENAHYDQTLNNWPDFRQEFFDQQSIDKYLNFYRNREFTRFERPNNMTSWCHGAPGIGLNRLQFEKEFNSTELSNDVLRALSATKSYLLSSNKPVHVLCHGTAGNAFLFLEYYTQAGNLESLEFAREMALKIIESRKAFGHYYSGYSTAGEREDLSLFMGTAGIGYFMLACLFPNNVTNYLLPSIKIVDGEQFTPFLSKSLLCELLLKKTFKYSYDADFLDEFVEKIALDDKRLLDSIIDLMAKATAKSTASQYYNLERRSLVLDSSIKSLSLSYIGELDKIDKVRDKLNGKYNLENKKVMLSKNTLIDTIENENSEDNLIFYVNFLGRKSFIVNSDIYLLLAAATDSKEIAKLREEFLASYEIANSELEKYSNFFHMQLRQLLESGMLEFCEV